MKKGIVISLSAFLVIASVLGILGTQLLSGNNPPDLVMFVIMMIIGGSAEAIAFTTFKNKILKILPLIASIALVIWGIYLYLFSESWINATVPNLICGYCSPAIGCMTSIILLKSFPTLTKG